MNADRKFAQELVLAAIKREKDRAAMGVKLLGSAPHREYRREIARLWRVAYLAVKQEAAR